MVVLQRSVVLPQSPSTLVGINILTLVSESLAQSVLAKALSKSLYSTTSASINIASFGDMVNLEQFSGTKSNTFSIVLCEWKETWLCQLDNPTFAKLKHLLQKAAGILWVSSKAAIEEDDDPFQIFPASPGLITGLSRTIRTEYPEKKVVTLNFELEDKLSDDDTEIDSEAVKTIIKVLQSTLAAGANGYEPEYIHRTLSKHCKTTALHIPRLRRSHTINTHLSAHLNPTQIKTGPFISPIYPNLTLTITSPGLLDTLTFIPNPPPPSPLPPNEILIHPSHVDLNFLDLLTALDRIPTVSVLGVEAAGTVVAAGSASDLKPGDRVAVLTDGALRNQVRAHYLTTVKIPRQLSFEDAASIPGTACTVYRALMDVANLQRGESVLIHAGAGATGQMAIQLAMHLGAVMYVTVGSEKKKRLVCDTYGLDEDNVFYSRDASFADAIKRRTGGVGVDVVLNSLAGELLDVGWEDCVAPFGRWVELGKRDVLEGRKVSMRTFARNVTFACVGLSGIWQERPAMMRRLLERVFGMVERGEMSVVSPVKVFGVGDVEGAMRSLQSGKEGGKAVIRMDPDEEVRMMVKDEPKWVFDGNASYVIVGGLGGLGRSVARWMVRRGARHLLLLSRGAVGENIEKKALLEELRKMGCNLRTPRCDIADRRALEDVLKDCQKSMPTIRGCVQASMVLKDQYFADMTFDEWTSSISPKVRGSWNLHSVLPKKMDFFVLFSSIVGVIGGAGQANYAAGNAYQDALARYRLSIGEKAVSLDLGMMMSEGVVAEDPKLARALESTGYYQPMTVSDLEGILERYCDPTLQVLSPDEAQVVCGIEVPAVMSAKGIAAPAWMVQPLFRHLHILDGDGKSSSDEEQAINYKALFENAGSLKAAGAIVTEALVGKLSKSLAIPSSDIDSNKPLHYYGVDSLVAVELRNWFAKELSADVAIFNILGNASCEAVGVLAAGKSTYKLESWGRSPE